MAVASPRLLTIMGSGETAPTMAKVHRQVLERVLGRPGAPGAVLLDTPYGFQENADDISTRTQAYFQRSVGFPIEVASFRSREVDAAIQARAMATVAQARLVFAGPGSPTYALEQWRGTALPGLLVDKLQAGGEGGAVTFASAAALTLGVATVPVYEIYKAGHPPRWCEGLDLLGTVTGLRAAVIPHYDNAEGGHHDTRYCYLGERRLAVMEQELDPDVVVLGVDEHTALVLDLDAGEASVIGLGGVTIRHRDHQVVHPAGRVVPLAALTSPTSSPDAPPRALGGFDAPARAEPAQRSPEVGPRATPLVAEATALAAAFDAALAAGEVPAAVDAVLALDRALDEWGADTFQSDEPDRVRATLHSMVVRLGDLAARGARDPRTLLAPAVESVLAVRARARAAGDWATADELRAGLAAAGIEVRDTPDGQVWHLTGEDHPASG